MPARAAVAIAIGASSAAVAMLPGPIDASAAASTKNMIGIDAALPRQTRTAWCASRSSVPLHCAMREQQRHAGQRQEQLARKAAPSRVRPACRRCRRRRSTPARSPARRR